MSRLPPPVSAPSTGLFRLVRRLLAKLGPHAGETEKTAGAPPREEAVRGDVHYLQVLATCHRLLKPQRYLEIGVRSGRSLALATCPAVGVDPAPALRVELPPTTRLFTMTSDEFFAGQSALLRADPPEFAFIDGQHLFEYALRDFMHVEQSAAPGCLVAIDDVFPSHAAQAARRRRTRVWTGDVWKLHRALVRHRPDLFLLPLDTLPTGLLLIAGLDPANTTLKDLYPALAAGADDRADNPPTAVLERAGVLPATHPVLARVLAALADSRSAALPPAMIVARLRSALAGATERREIAGDRG